MIRTSKLLMILTTALGVSTVMASSKEVERYYKCHTLFVNERVSDDDPLLAEVKRGQRSGTEACMKLLSRADIQGNGRIAGGEHDSGHDEKGMKILRNFLLFYKSQLKVPNYAVRLSNSVARTADVIDSNEPTYHYLYTLFRPGESYANLVTRDYSLQAHRYSRKYNRGRSISSVEPTLLSYVSQSTANSCRDFMRMRCDNADTTALINACKNYDDSTCDYYMWIGTLVRYVNPDNIAQNQNVPDITKPFPAQGLIPEFAETGLLVGISPESRNNVLPFATNTNVKSYDMHAHFGGGILGSQAYILGNLTTLTWTQLNGGTKLQRRYGENVLADFLCRPNPTLRSIDIMDEVNASSSIPFRQGISCMRCHSGMDPLGGVARNFINNASSNHVRGNLNFISQFNVSAANQKVRNLWNSTGSSSTYRQTAPVGRLYYRGFDGSLIREEVDDVRHLGEVIAEQNDFYACAAKRHFKFLTGIDVNLDDIGDMNFPKLTPQEKVYRDRVIKLGLQLKEHQSLKELIREIIESDTFIYPDKGV